MPMIARCAAVAALALASMPAPVWARTSEYAPWPPPSQTSTPPASDATRQPLQSPSPPPAGPNDNYTAADSPNAAELGAPTSPQLVPPSQEGSKNLSTAAEAPLHDMNLVRQHIPPVLMDALADPYVKPRPLNCSTLGSQVDRLTVALGPDFDDLPPSKKKGLTTSGGLGLELANGAAGSLLPFQGFVGTLSGAHKHDALVMRAIAAGDAERAYLKGLGEARRCAWPAAPRRDWRPPPPGDDTRFKPRYPIGRRGSQ